MIITDTLNVLNFMMKSFDFNEIYKNWNVCDIEMFSVSGYFPLKKQTVFLFLRHLRCTMNFSVPFVRLIIIWERKN